MNGILLVDKPKDYTSHDIVYHVRNALKTKKVGHSGTLDPEATGVLVLGINNGTKIMKYLNQDQKTYQATICIGKTTTTLDDAGEVIEEKDVTTIQNIDNVFASFQGDYKQIPPMYSAVKHKGKRLYEYARKGITIENRRARDIKIIDIYRNSDIIYKDGLAYVNYVVTATKGLYVRTLSYDIGKALGYPSYNFALTRLQAGIFTLDMCYSLEDVKNGQYSLVSLSDALPHFERIIATKKMLQHIPYGRAIAPSHFTSLTTTRIVDENNNLLAIYDYDPENNRMKPQNVFIQP